MQIDLLCMKITLGVVIVFANKYIWRACIKFVEVGFHQVKTKWYNLVSLSKEKVYWIDVLVDFSQNDDIITVEKLVRY